MTHTIATWGIWWPYPGRSMTVSGDFSWPPMGNFKWPLTERTNGLGATTNIVLRGARKQSERQHDWPSLRTGENLPPPD